MKEMALSGTGPGEGVSNFKTLGEHEIEIGDRAYCRKQGITYVSGVNRDFLFWLKRMHGYTLQGKRVNVGG
jgi:hypothetical protein